MDHIAVAIDFSDQSRLALRLADDLAVRTGAKLTLVHVHPVVDVAIYDFAIIQSPEDLARETARAESTLRDWAHDLGTPAARVTSRVVVGAPIAEIIKFSERADLLVLGTHGRKGLSHFLLGSVAERAARGAHCSVLIAKG
jgi:universal stress protein A